MTVVVGTAGHIDHGKTTLLRALTGIDADRLPEEQRRGMTIDVGFAYLDLEDGTSIDFVDVPGHDALIGNMLVGAGEIDAAMVVVAADDGPRAQTLEHLELLDALGIRLGIVVITKADVVEPARVTEVAAATVELVSRTRLAGSPVLVVSATRGDGVAELRAALLALRDRVLAERAVGPAGPLRLAIDRAFTVRGRGVVVTGSLRGGQLQVGDSLRLEPGGIDVRVRGLHVHHGPVDAAGPGRVAINLAGADLAACARGTVVTSGPGIQVSSRLLVALGPPVVLDAPATRQNRPTWPPADGARGRIHLGTAQVDASLGMRGRDAVDLPDGRVTAILRLNGSIPTFVGDRGVARRSSPGDVVAGFQVLDPEPARAVARRRASPERLAVLAAAVRDADVDAAADALIGLHGILNVDRVETIAACLGSSPREERGSVDRVVVLAPDIRTALQNAVLAEIEAFHRDHPLESGIPLGTLRPILGTVLRRLTTIGRQDGTVADGAIGVVLDDLAGRHKLARDGDRLRDPGRTMGPPPELQAAMARLEAALNVPAPPALFDAARLAGCPAEGIRTLEAAGRIVRVEADLAWAAPSFHRLAATALAIARRQPLTPAALRDATGTSRRYVMPLIEDLNRRGILARTPAGHVPGPRAPREPATAK
ncbi:MAG: selenocysteine-specific translation elongation factor [Chloroflexi bacterium]|nr:selenocysteine-specific translation elongation factor [Chloroflexota bacterium]